AVALAVLLTAIRLLPMTVVLMPYLRGSPWPRGVDYLAAHFVAITAWVEALRRLPPLPPEMRLPYFCGFGAVLVGATLVATALGYHMAAILPPTLSAALLFLTPIYFILSLILAAANEVDRWAILLGALIGPGAFLLLPGLDLLITGLVGGSVAFVIGRRRARRAS
ncbi:MAG: AzlC family ABC transporter permease, partial [Pseudomonadota bacterium]